MQCINAPVVLQGCCHEYLSISTHPLQLDGAKTDDDIDTILDQPAGMFIINLSGWSVVEPVTTKNTSDHI